MYGLKLGTVRKLRTAHSLVAEAFIGPRPEGLQVCHNDGDPTNNMLANLRYDTPSENQTDIVRHGKHFHANKTHCPSGHAYAEHAYSIPSRPNARYCRACQRSGTA
nr:HNH endonuclease signature motif containing protein [Nocardia wallacei]